MYRCSRSLEKAISHTDPSPRLRLADEGFLHELAVLLKHLDPVVGAVADIQQTVIREIGGVHQDQDLLRLLSSKYENILRA